MICIKTTYVKPECTGAVGQPTCGGTANVQSGYIDVVPQPTDKTTCSLLVATKAEIAATDYDYASASAMWGFAFTTVFGLWYLSKNLGMIINAVKRW